MEKKDLKNLMVVELRNGNKYVVVDGLLIGINDYGALCFYEESLRNKLKQEYDIVKVYAECERWGLGFKDSLEYKDNKLIWGRPKELLTKEEKEYLKAVIKPLTCKVLFVMKLGWISIKLDDDDEHISLAFTSNMTLKFEGLERGKEYTLEELGLED